ncbi:MAG TPA: DUF454 domain-containing protein, partial [Phycisphaerales bacterium]|nr:DUF454 domain-containing protein [Phycisphaerales bacterium]
MTDQIAGERVADVREKPAACPVRRMNPVRLWLAGMGVLSVGIGAVGVFVPGLPTTIFLIIASWCFARSCPWLERRLIRNRLFRPFLLYLEPGASIPTRARVISTVALVVAVSLSVSLMIVRGVSWWVPVVVVAAGAVGVVFIWRSAR